MAGDEAGVTLGQPHLSRQDLGTLVSAARGAPRSKISLPGLGGGAPKAEGADGLFWVGGWGVRPEGLRALLLGSTAADAFRGGAGGGDASGSRVQRAGGRGTRARGRAAAREQVVLVLVGVGRPGEALLLPVRARRTGSASRWCG